jgi:hypothetical protein
MFSNKNESPVIFVCSIDFERIVFVVILIIMLFMFLFLFSILFVDVVTYTVTKLLLLSRRDIESDV